MPFIEARGLIKDYETLEKRPGLRGAIRALLRPPRKTVRAVDGIDLRIERGEMVGYLGPNGAGKSTTIKMLVGILHPTAGEVRIGGLSPLRHRTQVAQRIGVVFGQRTQLYWDLRLGESFELLRRIYRVSQSDFDEVSRWLDHALGLRELLDTPVRQLSLGQRMRGELAAAMIHRPEVLFLDEPTIGLDIDAKQRIREFIHELNQTRQTTVMLTTHDLGDVEKLCRRLVVINHGVVIRDGPLRELVETLAPERLLVVDCERPPEGLEIPGAEVIRTEGHRIWVRFHRSRTTAPAVIQSIASRIPIVELSVQEPAIEDMIRRIYAESAPGARAGRPAENDAPAGK